MNKILITGGSGFLGKNLYKYLKDNDVISINKNNKIENGWFCDLNRKDSVESLLTKVNPEIIIHCAANPSPKHPEDYNQFLQDNVISTVNLLENCNSKIKFIFKRLFYK